MICKKCGCRVSDTAMFCDKCGASMAEFGEKESEKAKDISFAKKNKKLIAVVAILVLCLIGFVVAKKMGMLLDQKTKYAVIGVQAIKEDLLVPDSINVLDVMVYEKPEDEIQKDLAEDEDGTTVVGNVYVYCSATNRGGGITDEEYLCNILSDGTCVVKTEDSQIEEYEGLYTMMGLEPDEDLCEEWGKRDWQEAMDELLPKMVEVNAKTVMNQLK